MTLFPEKISELKDYNCSENAFLPRVVTIPLSQELKCTCESLVKEGDVVTEGQIIAQPSSADNKYANIHASIPGKVLSLINCNTPNGRLEPAIKIALEGSFDFVGKKFLESKITELSPAEIIDRITQAGVINIFDTKRPENLSKLLKSATGQAIVVRLFDEDSTRITDSLITKFYLPQLIEAAKFLAKSIDSNKIVFVCDSKQADFSALEQDDKIIVIHAKHNKYTAGFKSSIISLFHKYTKKNPTISFKLSKKDVFIDSSSLYDVHKAVVTKIPSISKIVHFSGNCLKTSGLLNVKIGTTIRDILKQIGGLSKEPKQIIINGSIRGTAVNNLAVPITKYVKSVAVITKKSFTDFQIYSCISCGNCRLACPSKLLPDVIYNLTENNVVFSDEVKTSVKNCIECGCCNMFCPARLPLTQTQKTLKEKFFETQEKNNEQ